MGRFMGGLWMLLNFVGWQLYLQTPLAVLPLLGFANLVVIPIALLPTFVRWRKT